MTHITKRTTVRDPFGRVLGHTVERLHDNGVGATGVHRSTVVGRCPGCWRPIPGVELVGGVCTMCARGPLCRLCETACAVCGRGLCRRCRRGFVWGRTPMVVCPVCYAWLNRRAVHEQREAARQAAFQRAVQLHRERMHGLAVRIQMARLDLSGTIGAGHVRRR